MTSCHATPASWISSVCIKVFYFADSGLWKLEEMAIVGIANPSFKNIYEISYILFFTFTEIQFDF